MQQRHVGSCNAKSHVTLRHVTHQGVSVDICQLLQLARERCRATKAHATSADDLSNTIKTCRRSSLSSGEKGKGLEE